MRLLTLTLIAVCLTGCSSPSGERMEAPKERKVAGPFPVGEWKGKAKSTGTSSEFLNEKLGGFDLEFRADGTFLADWRGLTKEGRWKLDGRVIELIPEKVLGKTRAESGSDSSLFDTDNILERSSDDKTFTLKPKDKTSESVVFSRP